MSLAPDGPRPLGLTPIPGGVAARVWAPDASGVDLCLFDDAGVETRASLARADDGVWSADVAGVGPGQRYGFRADGPWEPEAGLRFNPARLLLDPYARGIDGTLASATAAGYEATRSTPTPDDSAPFVPRSVLLSSPRRSTIARPAIPWERTVVYEAHVKGLTTLCPAIPETIRGTYAALGHPAVAAHLVALGATTLELLPLHAHVSEPRLERAGLTNYWGYNTIAFFAPHPAYATAAARAAGPDAILDEVTEAIDRLHDAGIEVLLDVVYNHTGEGRLDERHVSWRGLAERRYYRHPVGRPGELEDVTGTGNSLDFSEPRVVETALASMRYWYDEVGVDGFRLDLAVTLARGPAGFDPRHPFLLALADDPVLRRAKIVAEPWDIGVDGYRSAQFPDPVVEWNDRFRDAARLRWLHGTDDVPSVTTRHPRGPLASVVYVTCHDGMTLRDLASYNDRHNDANGEDGCDGHPGNHSSNHGVEGETDDPTILAARRRSERNLLGELLLAAGVPMILGGDEWRHTQRGNNNAYCHDSPLTWLPWAGPADGDHVETIAHLARLRRDHPGLATGRDEGLAILANPGNDEARLALPPSARGWRLAWDSAWDSPHDPDASSPEGGEADVVVPPHTTRVYVVAGP